MKRPKRDVFRNNLKLSILSLIALSLIIICLIPITNTELVIHTSVAVSPGVQDDPYNSGTVHHARILCKSILSGDITIQGENIYLTVYGYNTQHLKHILIEAQYRFVINPAEDLYIFIFDNTEGQNESLIEFKLVEKWMSPMIFMSPIFFMIGIIGGALFLSCLIYFCIIIGIKKNKIQKKSS